MASLDRYDRLKAAGLCVQCGKKQAVQGGALCEEHGMAKRLARRKKFGYSGMRRGRLLYAQDSAQSSCPTSQIS